MKKYILPLLLSATITAECKPLVEGKAGYFFFTDSTMQKVYNQGGIDVQLSGSYPMWGLLHIYGSAEYAERAGHSLGKHERTTIQLVPLSVGLKPVFAVSSWIDYYFTVGPRYSFVWERNHSSSVDHRVSKNGLGGFVNTGFLFMFKKHFTFDLFGEYSYVRMSFHAKKHNVEGHTKQVGGLTFGAGLGTSF